MREGDKNSSNEWQNSLSFLILVTVFLAGNILAERRKGKVSAKYFEPVHNDGIKYSMSVVLGLRFLIQSW